MPHKKNPILSENLTGLARLVRSAVIPALENIALWHERDISHSAVERNIGPDATIALDFALSRLSNVVKNLNIYPKKMLKNLNITKGIFFSQRVLLELTTLGYTREQAYKIVQSNTMKAWKQNSSFLDNLISDKKVTRKIPVNKLKKLFNFSLLIRFSISFFRSPYPIKRTLMFLYLFFNKLIDLIKQKWSFWSVNLAILIIFSVFFSLKKFNLKLTLLLFLISLQFKGL